MTNDKVQFTDIEPPKDKQQANINPTNLQQGHGDSAPAAPRSDLNKLGFPSSDNLLAYSQDGKVKDQPAATENKTRIAEQLRASGKSAERLQPLVDSMGKASDITLGQNKDNLSVVVNNAGASKVDLPKDTAVTFVTPKSVEFGKEVKFNFNDGKLTNISGIKVNVDAPKDGELRIGGTVQKESFSMDIKEATIEKEDGKDYLKARVAPYPDDPETTFPIRIPLAANNDQTKVVSYKSPSGRLYEVGKPLIGSDGKVVNASTQAELKRDADGTFRRSKEQPFIIGDIQVGDSRVFVQNAADKDQWQLAEEKQPKFYEYDREQKGQVVHDSQGRIQGIRYSENSQEWNYDAEGKMVSYKSGSGKLYEIGKPLIGSDGKVLSRTQPSRKSDGTIEYKEEPFIMGDIKKSGKEIFVQNKANKDEWRMIQKP